MELTNGGGTLRFQSGGVEALRDGKRLYCNPQPMFVTVKSATTASEPVSGAYAEVTQSGGKITGSGMLVSLAGSEWAFADTYEAAGDGFRVSRSVKVLKAGDDLGFSSKISFVMAESADPHDFNCFSPGVWYQQNEFAPDSVMGKDLDCEYFWQLETACALPLFAMQHKASGETASISRWAADVTMRDFTIAQSENSVDPLFTIGALGMSKPKNETLNYMYYGFAMRKPTQTPVYGLSIDYVYPGCEGQKPSVNHFGGLDFQGKVKTFQRINHPVAVGFEQNYSVAVSFGRYDGFQPMMRDVWRAAYARLRDDLFEVDNARFFHDCMNIFRTYTRAYGDSYGLPFACQLPDMDVNCVSFQFGFVGQQPGIGYLMLRYGDKEHLPDATDKGMAILDFWAREAMTASGLPQMCYNPTIKGFEPYPHYVRMLADGIEAILDAYVYLRKKGVEKPAWLEFCRKTADWLLSVQNEDGSFYRSYNTDGSIRMLSKSNTPSVIRFLVQFYLVTKGNRYRDAAIRAGDWSLDNCQATLEYRGGTCDNTDIQDKEAGIYGLFGFLALYDLTGEQKWLEGAVGAADYTETWTYAWKFPVRTPWPKHPFNQYSISGQSIITVGGGADVYMAACSYAYYRLYVITGDGHYLDFAEFIHKNTRQSNDVDGSSGYILPGLGHESGYFVGQTLQSQYHWLPWCTYVEADPSARLYDTFGGYEIADAQRLSPEERERRNRIYDDYV